VRRLLLAGLVLATLAPLGGCKPEGGPPPGKDWFGNPVPTGAACNLRPPVARHKPPYDPNTGMRPPVVPPGWRWVVIELTLHAVHVHAKTLVADVNHCVPVRVHVYASQEGNPEPIKMEVNSGQITDLPYDGVQVTPWANSYFIFAYDPSTWKHEFAPSYRVELIATWDEALDNSGADPPTLLTCHIVLGGGTPLFRGESSAKAVERKTATCRYSGNHYWA
jgi:hypothetical protein